MPQGNKGLIPDSKYYDKYYPSFRWRAVSTISNAIGQGQVLTTPIQLANMTAAVANRGYFYTPHIVKKIKENKLDNKYTTPKKTAIDSIYFEPVIKGMYDVFEKGTGRYSKVKGIDICGKTGTVQNYVKRDGKKIAMADHSIFIAFAPKDNPKIAIAIFIENGKYGLINKNNKILIEAKYDWLFLEDEEMKYGLCSFFNDKYNGLLDIVTGKMLFTFNFSLRVRVEKSFLKHIKKDNKQGLINMETKNFLIELTDKKINYEEVGDNLLRVQIGFKFGLINYEGKQIIEFTNLINYYLKEKKYLTRSHFSCSHRSCVGIHTRIKSKQ